MANSTKDDWQLNLWTSRGSLKSKLREFAIRYENAREEGTEEMTAFVDDMAEAITAHTAQEVMRARIDELNQVLGNMRDNPDCTTCYTNNTKIERHYFELQQSINKEDE